MKEDNNKKTHTVEELTPNQYVNQIQTDMLGAKSDVKHEFIQDLEGIEKVFDKTNIPKKCVLYWKGNKGCTFTVGKRGTAVKLMIQDCHDCVFNFNGPIITNFIELWRCKNVTLNIATEVGTMQVDLSENIRLNYIHKKYFVSVVQAGVTNLNIDFQEYPELNLLTGIQFLRDKFEDVDDNFDQFITRFVNKELLTEILIRAQGGYPTTERELKELEDMDTDERNKRTVEKLLGTGVGQAFGIDEKEIIAKSNEGKAQLAEKSKKESQSNLKKNQAGKAYTNGKYDKAIILFTEAIELNATYVLYSNRSACHIQLKQWEMGLEDAEKCIQLNDDFAKGHYRKGLCLSELGRHDEAYLAIKEAYDIEPEDQEIVQKLNSVKELAKK
jgi:tetratricopeptide (TPR) repeat protein